MNRVNQWIVALALAICIMAMSHLIAQTKEQKPKAAAPQSTQSSNEDLNIRAYIELLRSDVKAEASAIVAEVMQLDDSEAAKFWPIYREYELELTKQGDKRIELIKKYADNHESMSDDVADQLAQGSFALEQSRLDLKKKYYEHFKQALSAKTAARFLQVNNQILMLIDLQIASSLPVIK